MKTATMKARISTPLPLMPPPAGTSGTWFGRFKGVLCVLVVLLGGHPICRVAAQTFTVLHSFVGGGAEGANPNAGLVLSSNSLYGVTSGPVGFGGTVFKVKIDGTRFEVLHAFGGDGRGRPLGDLALSGGTLY